MRNPTEMMRAILTNETAQRIIDFVSPIYGNSYVGLWIYQAIGVVLGEAYAIADQLQYETTPSTSVLLLDYWEDHYKIPRDSSLTPAQRRDRILTKIQSRPPCTPARLASTISSVLNGVPVEVQENVAKNMFLVTIKGSTGDITPAKNVIERMKPAHLIYRMKAEIDAKQDLKVASAITHAESYALELGCAFYETVDTSIMPASVITHAENFTVEVFN